MSDNLDINSDIIIIGAGIVGLSLACALAKESDENRQIYLLDAKSRPEKNWPEESVDLRVSAITHASQNFLSYLGVWHKIKSADYQQMYVWDATGGGDITFDAAELAQKNLGHIVENREIIQALLIQAESYDNLNLVWEQNLKKAKYINHHWKLTGDKNNFKSKLLIGADGARSWLRNQVGIIIDERDYEHHGLVCTVKTEKFHDKTARQIFLPDGPLAFLPLKNSNLCSIVWSTNEDEAEHLRVIDPEDFNAILTRVFENKLGQVSVQSPRVHFPLKMRHAKQYVRQGLAFVGDAAHTIHPLAGQGLNLGLLDAAALADVIIQADNQHRDFASLDTLRRYERWRRGHNTVMIWMMDGFKNLFASEVPFLRRLRSWGMKQTDRLGILKNQCMRFAMGRQGDLPRFCKKPVGE